MWVTFAWARRFGDVFRNYYFLLLFCSLFFLAIFLIPAHLTGRVRIRHCASSASILYIFPVGSFYGNNK